MAKMKRPVGDLMSGKLGNVVFVHRNDKSYVRMAPIRKHNNWSEQQIMYRKRLSSVSQLWRNLKSDLSPYIWNNVTPEMNGYAFFIKTNIQAFSIDGSLIDPKLIMVSNGHLIKSRNMNVSLASDPDFVDIQWQNDPNLKSARGFDQLVIQTYGEGIFSKPMVTSLPRKDLGGAVLIPKPAPFTKATHIYVFFANEDQNFSQSDCFEI